jgi:export-related chaperone CsaA
MATFDEFAALDIRAGTVVSAAVLEGARRPAYRLEVDLGPELGVKQSSAQITELYAPQDLIGHQVLAVVNFPVKLIAGFRSEILVLGVYTEDGVVLIKPERSVTPGTKLG